MKSYSDNIIDTAKIELITNDHDIIKASIAQFKTSMIAVVLLQLALDVVLVYKLFF